MKKVLKICFWVLVGLHLIYWMYNQFSAEPKPYDIDKLVDENIPYVDQQASWIADQLDFKYIERKNDRGFLYYVDYYGLEYNRQKLDDLKAALIEVGWLLSKEKYDFPSEEGLENIDFFCKNNVMISVDTRNLSGIYKKNVQTHIKVVYDEDTPCFNPESVSNPVGSDDTGAHAKTVQ